MAIAAGHGGLMSVRAVCYWPVGLISATLAAMIRILTALILMTSVALAEAPMSGAEFDAYTKGKTLTYMEDGQSYGIEEYLPGRQVKWAFEGNECQDGHWWEAEAGLICFAYENSPDAPQCWNFFKSDTGLRAVFTNEPDRLELYEARRSRQPLLCLGPEVGA